MFDQVGPGRVRVIKQCGATERQCAAPYVSHAMESNVWCSSTQHVQGSTHCANFMHCGDVRRAVDHPRAVFSAWSSSEHTRPRPLSSSVITSAVATQESDASDWAKSTHESLSASIPPRTPIGIPPVALADKMDRGLDEIISDNVSSSRLRTRPPPISETDNSQRSSGPRNRRGGGRRRERDREPQDYPRDGVRKVGGILLVSVWGWHGLTYLLKVHQSLL